MSDPSGFAWQTLRGGEVQVLHHSRVAVTLRGVAALDFLAEVQAGDDAAAQQLMARLTGNYKRGNERLAASHLRNRRP
jgi:hypothetical protein